MGSKVGRILLARPRMNGKIRAAVRRGVNALRILSRRLESLVGEDARAYEALVKAQRSGRNLSRARRRATRSPLAICLAAKRGIQGIDRLVPMAGPHLGSDLKAGKDLLKAAFQAAQRMAQINQRSQKKSRRG